MKVKKKSKKKNLTCDNEMQSPLVYLNFYFWHFVVDYPVKCLNWMNVFFWDFFNVKGQTSKVLEWLFWTKCSHVIWIPDADVLLFFCHQSYFWASLQTVLRELLGNFCFMIWISILNLILHQNLYDRSNKCPAILSKQF